MVYLLRLYDHIGSLRQRKRCLEQTLTPLDIVGGAMLGGVSVTNGSNQPNSTFMCKANWAGINKDETQRRN